MFPEEGVREIKGENIEEEFFKFFMDLISVLLDCYQAESIIVEAGRYQTFQRQARGCEDYRAI